MVPVAFWRGTADAYSLPKLTILWIAAVGALALLRGLPRVRLAYAAAAVLGATVLSTAFSQNPLVSVLGLYRRYGGLVPLALYVVIFVLVAGLFRDRTHQLAWTVLIASSAVAIHALAQKAGGAGFPPGTLGNSQFTGAFLGIALPLGWYVRVASGRATFVLIAVPQAAALWFTQSRSGMLAAGAGWAVVMFMERRRPAAVGIVGAGALLVALAFWLPPASRPQVLRAESLRYRAWSWSAGWRMFADHPLTGMGPDTFYENYSRYRPQADAAALGLVITDKPHNVLLEKAATTGALGLMSYLALAGLALRYGVRECARSQGRHRALCAAFVGVLCGYLAQAMFSIDVPPLALVGWLALGAVAALVPLVPGGGEPGRVPVPVAAAVATVLIVVGVRPFVADLRSTPPGAAARLNPLEPRYRLLMGWEAESRGGSGGRSERSASVHGATGPIDVNEARSEWTPRDDGSEARLFRAAVRQYLRAWEMQPGNVHIMLTLARAYEGWGEIDPRRFQDADRWWARAAAHDPADPDLRSMQENAAARRTAGGRG